jgi:predicted amidohydrolase YtcJ
MKILTPYLLILITLFFAGACQQKEAADLVLWNATVYTVNDDLPAAQAVAVKSGNIVAVGSNEEVRELTGQNTREIDLDGKTVVPGLIEAHGHFMGMGESMLNINLLQAKSYEELVDAVEKAVAKAEPGEWILGRGWHQDKWDSISGVVARGFPTHELLSEVSPENPVFLKHASGHASLVNQYAMEMAGIEKNTPSPDGGEIIKDEQNNPTGILNETASNLVARLIPVESKERAQKAFKLAVKNTLAHGITSFHDAGEDARTLELYKEMAENGQMGVRLYVMLSGSESGLLEDYYMKGPEVDLYDSVLTIRSIKLYADGALGSRGAWLIEPYNDAPKETGHTIMSTEYIENVAVDGLQNGFQVCTHAIGDRANREVLNSYANAFEKVPESAVNHRFRIEHAQHLHPEDISRFAELNVIPSMQGIHMSSDRPWAIDRLGKKRIEEGAYMWQALIQSGVKVINGTDVPVEPIDPMACFYALVTRKTLEGTPEGGYEPAQKMTRDQALKSYTLWAAYGAFEEDWKGSIEVGKVADLAVFDKDFMKVPEEEILDAKAVMTISDGRIVYER